MRSIEVAGGVGRPREMTRTGMARATCQVRLAIAPATATMFLRFTCPRRIRRHQATRSSRLSLRASRCRTSPMPLERPGVEHEGGHDALVVGTRVERPVAAGAQAGQHEAVAESSSFECIEEGADQHAQLRPIELPDVAVPGGVPVGVADPLQVDPAVGRPLAAARRATSHPKPIWPIRHGAGIEEDRAHGWPWRRHRLGEDAEEPPGRVLQDERRLSDPHAVDLQLDVIAFGRRGGEGVGTSWRLASGAAASHDATRANTSSGGSNRSGWKVIAPQPLPGATVTCTPDALEMRADAGIDRDPIVVQQQRARPRRPVVVVSSASRPIATMVSAESTKPPTSIQPSGSMVGSGSPVRL